MVDPFPKVDPIPMVDPTLMVDPIPMVEPMPMAGIVRALHLSPSIMCCLLPVQ